MSNLQELLNKLGLDNQYTRGVTKGLSDVLGGDAPRQEFQSVMSDAPRSNEDEIRDIVSSATPFALPALGAVPKIAKAAWNYPRLAGIASAPLLDDPSAAFMSPLAAALMYSPDADASKLTDSMKAIDKFVAAHGTPHVFPPTPRNPLGEFDMSKMGSGEGRQIFMKGHYLSGDENISRVHYRDRLTKEANADLDPLKWKRDAAAKRVVQKQNDGVTASAADMLAKRIARAGNDPMAAWEKHLKKPIGDKVADGAFKMGYGDVYLPASGVRNPRLKYAPPDTWYAQYQAHKEPNPITDLLVNHFGKMDPDTYYTQDTLKQLRSLDKVLKKQTDVFSDPVAAELNRQYNAASEEYIAMRKAADPSYRLEYKGKDWPEYRAYIEEFRQKTLDALPEDQRMLSIEHPLLPGGKYLHPRTTDPHMYPAIGGHLLTELTSDIKRGIPLKIARDKALQGDPTYFLQTNQVKRLAEARKALETKYPVPTDADKKVGALYSVLVNESPGNMLPLDMPLDELRADMPEVYEKFKQAYSAVGGTAEFDKPGYVTGIRTPKQLYDSLNLVSHHAQPQLSEELNKRGVQGNLFLNSGNRRLNTNREFDPRAFNYVLFNDEVPTIIDRELGGTLRPGKAHGGLLQIANLVENERRAKMAGGGLVKRMAKYFASSTDDVPRALKRAEIIKEPGGNWIAGSPDFYNLKSQMNPSNKTAYENILNTPVGTKLTPEHVNVVTKAMHEDALANLKEFNLHAARDRAVDKKLVPYVKNQMGTIQDPIREGLEKWPAEKAARKAKAQARLDTLQGKTARLMAEKGVPEEYLTAHRQEILKAQKSLDLIEANRGLHHEPTFNPDIEGLGYTAETRFKQGYPAKGVAKSEDAQRWESMTDSDIKIYKAGELNETAKNYPQAGKAKTVRENPWISKLTPETPIYSADEDTLNHEAGFSHMMDEVFNALRDGRVTPEQLEKMNIQQMSRFVGDIDAERMVNASDAAKADTAAMPLHKEYPSGHSWRQLRKPDTDVPLPEGMGVEETSPGNFKYFWPDKYDGHKRYSPPMNSIEEATAAAQDRAKHQVLQKWLTNEGDTMAHCVGGYCDDVAKGHSDIYSLRGPDGRPGVTIETTGPFDTQGYDAEGFPEILQIKGRGNQKPADEFQPMIEDFLRSGKWSGIADRDYTNLTPEQFDEILKPKGFAGGGLIKKIGKALQVTNKVPELPKSNLKNLEQWAGSRAIGTPDEMVKVYRAVPIGSKQSEILPGDWVSANPKYLADYAGPDATVIESVIPANELVDAQTGAYARDTLIWTPSKPQNKAGGGLVKRMAKYFASSADDVPRQLAKPEVLGERGAELLGIPRYEDMLAKEREAASKMKRASEDPRMKGASGNARTWTGAELKPRLEMPTQGFKPRSLEPIEDPVPLDQALQLESWLPKAYPDLLNDYKVRQTMSEPLGSGNISYGKGLITVGMDPSGLSLQDQAALIADPRKKEKAMMQTIGHELLGHGIADIERFTPGSSPDAMRKLLLSAPDLEARKSQQMSEFLMELANGADPMKAGQDYVRRNPELKQSIEQVVRNFSQGAYQKRDLIDEAAGYMSDVKRHANSLDKRNTIEDIVRGDITTYGPPGLLSAAKRYGEQKGLGPLDEKAFLGYRTNSGENEAELIAKRMDRDMFYKEQYPLVSESLLLNKYLHNISR